MSDSKTRLSYSTVMPVAEQICDALRPFTKKIAIAGSLRRGKDSIGDIELLFIPKFGQRPAPDDLFRTPRETNLVDDQLAAWKSDGVIRERLKSDGSKTWGAQIKLAVHSASGISVDFFSATDRNWWSLLVCRTGPAALNELICNCAISLGMKWAPFEGFKCRASDRLIYIPKSEKDLFKRIRLPYLPPAKRESILLNASY